jgi:hypothetical protein
MCLLQDAPYLLQVDGFSNAESEVFHRQLLRNSNNNGHAQNSVDERVSKWCHFALCSPIDQSCSAS